MQIIKQKKDCKALLNEMLTEDLTIKGILKNGLKEKPHMFWLELYNKTNPLPTRPIVYRFKPGGVENSLKPELLTLKESENMIWSRRKAINDYTKESKR